jgi:hypothetical protein
MEDEFWVAWSGAIQRRQRLGGMLNYSVLGRYEVPQPDANRRRCSYRPSAVFVLLPWHAIAANEREQPFVGS